MVKRKVLFIMHTPPPVHGASMVGDCIKRSKLVNSLFECRYINPSASNNVSEVGKVGVKKIIFLFRLLLSIFNTIRHWKPNAVYYTPTSGGWGIYRDMVTLAVVHLFNTKVILHMHNKGVSRNSRNIINRFVYRSIYKNANVILLADVLYDDIKTYMPKTRISILPNGVKTVISNKKCQDVMQMRDQKDDAFSFLYLSNLIGEKGIFVLLEACKLLKERGCKFVCHYVGNSGDVSIDSFKSMVSENQLDEFVFVDGPKYGEEKTPCLQNADAFVFPTHFNRECFPLVLLEAMQFGLPCISTYEGGIQEIVTDGENGFLVRQQDSVSLADKMQWMIEHREETLAMGSKSRERFQQRFTQEIFEQSFVEVIKEIFNK